MKTLYSIVTYSLILLQLSNLLTKWNFLNPFQLSNLLTKWNFRFVFWINIDAHDTRAA